MTEAVTQGCGGDYISIKLLIFINKVMLWTHITHIYVSLFLRSNAKLSRSMSVMVFVREKYLLLLLLLETRKIDFIPLFESNGIKILSNVFNNQFLKMRKTKTIFKNYSWHDSRKLSVVFGCFSKFCRNGLSFCYIIVK